MRIAHAIAAIMIAACVSSAHAALPGGPDQPSAAIRAARATSAQATIITYRATRGTEPAVEHTLALAPDFMSDVSPTMTVIHDFALRRQFHVDPGKWTFRNISLYSQVAFYAYEAVNRRMLRGVLGQTGSTQQIEMFDPFWVESFFGLPEPGGAAPDIKQEALADGTMIFSYHGKEVVRFRSSAQALTPGQMRRFKRFLRWQASIHPLILDAIVATGRMPASLKYTVPEPRGYRDNTFDFHEAHEGAAEYPLPAGMTAELIAPADREAGTMALAGVLPLMLDAVARRHVNGPPSADDYELSIDEALKRGANFDALLRTFAATLQYGQPVANCQSGMVRGSLCHPLREVAEVAKSDPRTQVLLSAFSQDQTNPAAAAAARQGISRDGLTAHYVLDIFIANALVEARKPAEAPPYFVAAIRGNPYIAGFYKDFGVYFQVSWRMDLAWLCFDLARALPDSGATGMLNSVDATEAKLRADFAEMF